MKLKAKRAWQPKVTRIPAMTQKIFFPDLSMRNPNNGDATAEMMYTKLSKNQLYRPVPHMFTLLGQKSLDSSSDLYELKKISA